MTMLTYTKTNLCVAVTANNFCARYDATCGGTNKWGTCDQGFGTLTAGSGTGPGNTQACRIHQLKLAEAGGSNVATHCPHASKAGTGFCDAGTVIVNRVITKTTRLIDIALHGTT